MRILAYVYPGWHPIPERDESFHPDFTEWELVRDCRPRFEGHTQPRVPLLGSYDDRDPVEVRLRFQLAAAHGVDGLVYGFFWCRGKRVFEDALDEGLLGSPEGRAFPFAVMWANRMPRRVLPVRSADEPVIADERRVPSDVADFVELISTVARAYFKRDNYIHVDGRPYFSIYDSTFFLEELGLDWAREAIRAARAWLLENGFGKLHLAAIEPSRAVIGQVRSVGFDSVTHYVHLPDWKGPAQQDYAESAAHCAGQWEHFAQDSGLPYMPSVCPGWDATPRAADFGAEKPRKYPWSPVIVGEHPDLFRTALGRARTFATETRPDDPIVFVASLNEWSEGHYLEPDTRFGYGWLEAIRASINP
ncbi:MAG: hypothetical protein ACI8QZ_003891 [Chlamydiales bacterium]|jgi:hypothetical protein